MPWSRLHNSGSAAISTTWGLTFTLASGACVGGACVGGLVLQMLH